MIVSRSLAVAAIAYFSFAGSAQAGPTLIFNFTETAVAAFLPPVGSVTLTQNGANSVNVFVDLPTGFGFVNTGTAVRIMACPAAGPVTVNGALMGKRRA